MIKYRATKILIIFIFFMFFRMLYSVELQFSFGYPILIFEDKNTVEWGPYTTNFSEIDYYSYAFIFYKNSIYLKESNEISLNVYLNKRLTNFLSIRIGGGIRKGELIISDKFEANGLCSGGMPDKKISKISELKTSNDKNFSPIGEFSIEFDIIKIKSINFLIIIGGVYEFKEKKGEINLYLPSEIKKDIDYWEISATIREKKAFSPYGSIAIELKLSKKLSLEIEGRVVRNTSQRDIFFDEERYYSFYNHQELKASEIEKSVFDVNDPHQYRLFGFIGFKINF